jgi:hypothetical protein
MKASEPVVANKDLPLMQKETNKESILHTITVFLLLTILLLLYTNVCILCLKLFLGALLGSVATDRVLQEEAKMYCSEVFFFPGMFSNF